MEIYNTIIFLMNQRCKVDQDCLWNINNYREGTYYISEWMNSVLTAIKYGHDLSALFERYNSNQIYIYDMNAYMHQQNDDILGPRLIKASEFYFQLIK